MALRALIAAIPHVGGSIDAIVAGHPATIARPVECRLLFMFAELHREVRTLDASDFREDFLGTKEWADLVRRALARAAQVRDCRRLSAIARVLAGAATGAVRLPGQAAGLVGVAPDARDEDAAMLA